jgi:thiamine transporter
MIKTGDDFMGAGIIEHAAKIIGSPASVAALLAVVILLLAFMYIRKIVLNTKVLVHISMAIALTIMLHTFRIYHLPQGGSITLGAMLPLMMIAFRYGPIVGYLAGFLFGFINLVQNPYILHPVQVLFDYPLPYMALGLAGNFKDNLFAGAILGVIGRLTCHFISGVVFFASFAPAGMSPYWYSFVTNAAYLLPEMFICLVLLRVLPVKRLLLHMTNREMPNPAVRSFKGL